MLVIGARSAALLRGGWIAINGAHPVVAVAIQAIVLPGHHPSGSVEGHIGAVHFRHLADDRATGRIPVRGIALRHAGVRIAAADLVGFADTAGIRRAGLVT